MSELWPIIKSLWQPALEIPILAVCIYYVLLFLRGTRSWAVVIGFVTLLILLRSITGILNLEVLVWLLDGFYALLGLAALVIFQPELRRLLAQLGRFPYTATAREKREDIETVIQSAERMSEMRIGALIAIEQSIQVQDAVESGIVVDCEATPEMLETIFFPNNAVHDGGVIIKDGRITHAACIFPLTQRQNLNKSLGTRHRAAIGLTEETDAVVVVVSEETGSISHVYKGQLVRGVSVEELRSFLTSILIAPPKTRSRHERLWQWWASQRHRLSAAAKSKGRCP